VTVETLIAELKRRRVFRVLVGYGLVAFALLQVVEPIQHALGMSDAVLKFVVVLLGLGFPVALVLAWAFDVGPGGIERTAPAATWKGIRVALALAGIGLLAAAPAESGAIEESLEKGKRAVELDPRSPVVRDNYAAELFYAGRDAEAEQVCDAVLDDAPRFLPCLMLKFDALLVRKDLRGARAHLAALAAPRGPEAVHFAGDLIDVLEGKAEALAVTSWLLPMPDGFLDPKWPTPLADNDAVLWFMAAGRNADAIARLTRLAHSLPHIAREVLVDRHSDPLRCEPRFKAVAKQVGFDDPRAATVCAGR